MKRYITFLNILILIILLFGLAYRVLLTREGNFLFNMDNARDMVDVREMVTLGKPRLIGPTSGIEGFYTGPFWYYVLAIPYAVSGGAPYAAIVMEMILWFIGGVYLLLITKRWGILPTIVAGALWVASNFIVLGNLYAFHPNLNIFLLPVFIFYLEKYLNSNKLIYSIIVFSLGGMFFNFEMAFGIFIPLIVFVLVLLKKANYLRTKNLWVGLLFFSFFLSPQILFEIRHEFLFTNSIARFLDNKEVGVSGGLFDKVEAVKNLYLQVGSAILMNWRLLTIFALLGFFILFIQQINSKPKFNDNIFLIISLIVIIPFLGYLFLPVNAMPWHVGAVSGAVVLLTSYIIFNLQKSNALFKLISIVISLLIIIYSIDNLNLGEAIVKDKKSNDPSLYRNEVSAIDYIYQKANGQDFKVYVYLPSVIDYPYQYLIWWHGIKRYGYVPSDYAYLPNKPKYISNKEAFSTPNRSSKSGLIFLMKEPDTNGFLPGWEGNFRNLETISREKVGPIEIEIKKEG